MLGVLACFSAGDACICAGGGTRSSLPCVKCLFLCGMFVSVHLVSLQGVLVSVLRWSFGGCLLLCGVQKQALPTGNEHPPCTETSSPPQKNKHPPQGHEHPPHRTSTPGAETSSATKKQGPPQSEGARWHVPAPRWTIGKLRWTLEAARWTFEAAWWTLEVLNVDEWHS